MPNELLDLTIDEVAFCRNGKNPGAKIALFKRSEAVGEWAKRVHKLVEKVEGDAQTFDEVMEQIEVRDEVFVAMDDLFKNMRVLEESLASILQDADVENKRDMVNQSLGQFKDAVEAALSSLAKAGNPDSKKGEITMPEQDAQKRLGELEKTVESLTKVLTEMGAKVEKKEDGGYTIEKPAAVLVAEPAVKALAEAGVTVKKADDGKIAVEVKKDEPEDPQEAVYKGMTPEARAAFEKMQKDAEADRAEVAKLKDERETEAITKRISESFGEVLPAAEFAPVLKKLGEADKEGLEKLETRLKALQEQLAKSALFKEIGGTGDGGDEDAIGKIEDLAKARATEKSISIFKARTEIRKENPELAAEERKQRDEAKKAA